MDLEPEPPKSKHKQFELQREKGISTTKIEKTPNTTSAKNMSTASIETTSSTKEIGGEEDQCECWKWGLCTIIEESESVQPEQSEQSKESKGNERGGIECGPEEKLWVKIAGIVHIRRLCVLCD